MNTSLTKDQINIMNSILDKELDFLSSDYNSANIVPDKENYSTQKARGLSSKDFDKSANSILYDRVNDSTFKEPRDITNQSNFKKHRTELQDPPNPSLRMQDDLIDLQSKIVDLEKKLGSLNNGPSPQRQREYNAGNNRAGGYGGYEEVGRVQRTLRDELNDSLDDSPLKKKYENKSPFKLSTDKLANSYKDNPYKDNSLSDSESPFKKRTQRGRRSVSNTSNKKPSKSALEQSIKEAQSQLDQAQARGSLRKRSFSRNKSSSNLRSASKKKAEDSPPKEGGNYQEIIILNKKLMEIKKARDEERSALLNERAKNQEMMVHLEKLNAKMKKMQIDLEKFAKIDVDYNRLMESFEKSEYIRTQQKQLISSLQQEIEELKRNNEPVQLKSSENDEMKKKKSAKSKTTTTKKKVLM